MSFFQLVRREMQGSLDRLAVMSGLGGVSNAAILAAINSGAQPRAGEFGLSSAALFVIALLLFIKTQHYILIATTVEIEAIIHKVRVRLMDQVRHSSCFRSMPSGARKSSPPLQETGTPAQATSMLAFAGRGVVLVFFVAICIAYLSLLAFALSVAIVCLAGLIFHMKSHQVAAGTQEAADWDNRLYDRLMDLLDGFKEVRLNRSRSSDLRRYRRGIENRSQHQDTHAERSTASNWCSRRAQCPAACHCRVRGPGVQRHEGSSILQVTTALMFIVGVCMGIVQTIPLPERNAGGRQYRAAGAQVAGDRRRGPARPPEPRKRFEKIEVRNVVFSYVDASSEAIFKVGPINFTLRSGELVFITGSSRSGKSTFLKLLSGLYEPFGRDHARRCASTTVIAMSFGL